MSTPFIVVIIIANSTYTFKGRKFKELSVRSDVVW